MQETCKNCFGSKKVKQEYLKIRGVIYSALVLTCFCLTKGHATFFRPETIVVSLLHLMVLFFKVIFNYNSNITISAPQTQFRNSLWAYFHEIKNQSQSGASIENSSLCEENEISNFLSQSLLEREQCPSDGRKIQKSFQIFHI